jgi:putative tricarboxylic transport membrane protein
VVPLSVVFFGLALDGLGFHVTAVLALAALFLAFGLGPVRAGAFALVAAFAIHGVFYSLLRVPLPWGVLTPVAW